MRMHVELDAERLAPVCWRWRVAELALFGSVLRDDFDATSDVDVLVEFEEGARIGFVGLGQLADELSALVGRPVDLVPKSGLKPLIREAVLADAHVVYAA